MTLTPQEQNRAQLQTNLEALRAGQSTTSQVPPAQASAPDTSLPYVLPPDPASQQGISKREADARAAQADMSKAGNALTRVLQEAKRATETLMSLLEKTSGIKESLSTIAPVSFKTPAGIDAELQESTPWLFEILTEMSAGISAVAASQNAFLEAFGVYVEAVSAQHSEAQGQSDEAMTGELDRLFTPAWRDCFDQEKPLFVVFQQWMSGLAKRDADAYATTLRTCRYAEDAEPIFSRFRLETGELKPAQPVVPHTREREAITPPGNAGPSVAPSGEEVEPLSQEDMGRYGYLLSQTTNEAERQHLRKRRDMAMRLSLRGTFQQG